MVIIGNKNIKELVWEVISDKCDKTRVILIKKVKVHPIYKKRFVVKTKYYVHDEENKSKLWDKIRVREVRPMSKLKRRNLIEIVK